MIQWVEWCSIFGATHYGVLNSEDNPVTVAHVTRAGQIVRGDVAGLKPEIKANYTCILKSRVPQHIRDLYEETLKLGKDTDSKIRRGAR